MSGENALLSGAGLGDRLSRRAREASFLLIPMSAIAATLTHPPVVQHQAYNHFADTRSFVGIPYFLDVVSNLPYVIIGAAGLIFSIGTRNPRFRTAFADENEAWHYRVLFFGAALTGFGSAYYHLAPSDNRLVWDRLPMTVIFMSWLSATISERVDGRAGLQMLPVLVSIGIYSIVYWHVTELKGSGDLRVYIDIQYLSLVAIPLLGVLFPSRYTRAQTLFVVFAVYLRAKLLELLDAPIYALGEVVSGHTLKHLASSVGAYLILDMLRKRTPKQVLSTAALEQVVG